MNFKKNFTLLILLINIGLLHSENRFSTVGFYAVPNSGREVFDFNAGWKFHLGNISGAEKTSFDDTKWEIISTPHTVQLVPAAASGGKNYQGVAWYRKHFRTPASFSAKKIFLHFEAIMGKSVIYINGKKVKEQFGGFLPIIIDLTKAGVGANEDVLVSVMADNSDDTSYPPGKPQTALDFCYFGGIYRDCWLYATDNVHFTDPNFVNTIAGGGVFVTTLKATQQEAVVQVKTQLVNETGKSQLVVVTNRLIDPAGKKLTSVSEKVKINGGETKEIVQLITVKNPALWHPDHPYLHTLQSEISANKKVYDAIETKTGIRTIEFVSGKGLLINGEIFNEKLLGVNRHQDFGYIGMALTNNLHYADVRKMRDAGISVIRSAHYPQDPAFMDACDQLGMFVIVATPGWQFWNDNGDFELKVLSDIRNMVRRDRNHPSVLLWEPILNETHFPAEFAERAYKAVHDEYPEKGCYAACDDISQGNELFDVIYTAPKKEEFYTKLGKCCFTREFGDCVDDWFSHNSYSRVPRDWSEQGLVFQAQHYAKKSYEGSLTIDQLFKAPAAHVGGALWHSFDHQRGYHPDPFYGGIMDEFRQPKYSYYMFQSQRNPAKKLLNADSGPVLFVANAMTPVSPTDVTVYSNCDSVRLQIVRPLKIDSKDPRYFNPTNSWENKFYTDTIIQSVKKNVAGLPYEPLTFANAFDFVTIRALHRSGHPEKAKIIADGFMGGQVVISQMVMPSMRSERIKLRIDSIASAGVVANGSDIVEIIASVEDERGYVKQLANEQIEFSILGEGTIIGGMEIGANPVRVIKGTAPLLLRTTTRAGKITVIARTYFGGVNSPRPDTLVFYTKSPAVKMLYRDEPKNVQASVSKGIEIPAISDAERKKQREAVEKDQQFFESTERKTTK